MDQDLLRSGLGFAIAAHRKVAGLTQEQLAEAVGCSTEWISRMERGLVFPRVEMLVAIGEAIGTPADQLLQDALGPGGHRQVVHDLNARVHELPDEAVEVLKEQAASLRERWPRSE